MLAMSEPLATPIILDNGAFNVKAGFAGDPVPRYVAPNCIARARNQLRVLTADEMDTVKEPSKFSFVSPFEHGLVSNVSCLHKVRSRALHAQ